MLDAMTHYQTITLNHANLKKPVIIVAGTIAGFHWSDASNSTYVYTTGGTFPVTETPDEVNKIITGLTTKKGETNVTTNGHTTRNNSVSKKSTKSR